MAEELAPISTTILKKQKQALMLLAKKEDRSVSSLMRQAIALLLKEMEVKYKENGN